MNDMPRECTMQELDNKDIIVVCLRMEMGMRLRKEAEEFYREQGMVYSSTSFSIKMKNGKCIEFVPDKEDRLRGRRNCIFVNLATFERMLITEKQRIRSAQRVRAGFADQ